MAYRRRDARSKAARQVLHGGLAVGIGLAATLDEIVLHQLLDWHHFLDRPQPDGSLTAAARQAGLVSDGLFHLVSATLLAAGFIMLLRAGPPALRGRGPRLAGTVLAGAGGFNLFDGMVQHKVLQIHQVRRDIDNLLPYDLAFNGVATVALIAGILLLRAQRGSR